MGGGPQVSAGMWAGTAAVVTLLLLGCSSSDDAATDTDTPITQASTPVAATTVVDSTSTISSTSVSASTDPPPTLEVMSEMEQEVRAAVDRSVAGFSACLVAMPGCDTASLAATRGDPLLAVNVARVGEWNAAGYTVVDRDQFRYVIEDVELSADGLQATVTVCVADGSKLVDPGAGPDGADLIVDGTYVSGREAWDMRLGEDGIWRVHDGPVIGATEATDVCPAA